MNAKHLYHAPSECPVCGDTLITTRKGCLHCGTELAGEFASCEFCSLNQADLDLLKVFLSSRGNLREVEKHLQVSYPTARLRLDAVLAKLGLDGEASAQEAARAAEDEPTEYGDEIPSDPGSVEDQILARVARGELSAEDAARLLG